MKRRLILSLIIGILPLWLSVSATSPARNTGSCVTCHTDEAMLKKTCKPFVMPTGEAEG